MSSELSVLNQPQWELVKKTVAKDADANEFSFFVNLCNSKGLNPLNKEIYFIKRGGNVTHQVSIEGFRLIAHRTGVLSGIKRGVEKRDSDWIAWAEVYRKDWDFPAREEVYLSEYTKLCANNPLWSKIPLQMLKKVAEAQALRMAFPEGCSGVYAPEEMPHSEVIEAEVIKGPDLKPFVDELNQLIKASEMDSATFKVITGFNTRKALIESLKTEEALAEAKSKISNYIGAKNVQKIVQPTPAVAESILDGDYTVDDDGVITMNEEDSGKFI